MAMMGHVWEGTLVDAHVENIYPLLAINLQDPDNAEERATIR